MGNCYRQVASVLLGIFLRNSVEHFRIVPPKDSKAEMFTYWLLSSLVGSYPGSIKSMAFSRLPSSRLPVPEKARGQKSRGQEHDRFCSRLQVNPKVGLQAVGWGGQRICFDFCGHPNCFKWKCMWVVHFPVKFTRVSIYSISCAET